MIMKKILTFIVLSVALLAMSACSQQAKEDAGKKSSSGKTLEILVVGEKNTSVNSTTKLIDSLFKAQQEGFMQKESKFDVVYIPRSSYDNSEMFKVHRNLILLDINPENPDKAYRYKDEYAAPQVIFEFAARNRHSLDSLIARFAPEMEKHIYDTEHRRIIKAFKSTEGYKVEKKVKDNFGFGLTFSEEFAVANMLNDFAWVRKEAKDFGLHVLVYTQPYTSKQQFDEAQILNNLDSIMKRVPSTAENSYIGTERRLDLPMRTTTLANRYCVETRGMWRSFGDFMGGPFVSYTLTSPDNKQLITLVGFVFSPRFPKRDYLMQVESICHSLTFEIQ